MPFSLQALLCVLFACGQLGSCSSDTVPRPAVLSAHAGDQVTLPRGDEFEYAEGVEVSWDLIETPAASSASVFEIASGDVVLNADLRGRFVLDRWITLGASERWTHRVFVDVSNAPPVPVIRATDSGQVGTSFSVDGRESTDSESVVMRYQWRFSYRPAGSAATFASPASAVTSLVPDVAGRYTLELDVFDGETWASAPATLDVHALR